MYPFSNLRRLFSGRRGILQTRTGEVPLPARMRGAYRIVGRGLCMYRLEDFSGVPRGKRPAALEFKLPVWSPFERTGYHCVWSGGAAMVWFWDRDRVAAAPGDRVVPETLFWPRKPDGVHLQRCREGFELQHWRAGVLADAFWFPERPGADQSSRFLARQEGIGPAAPSRVEDEPAAASVRMAPKPWSVSRSPREWLAANEGALAAACLAALALAIVWQEARLWKIRHLEETAAAEFARLQDELAPLLEARDGLLRLRRTNAALLEIRRRPSQAHLMLAVDRAVPGPDAEFREWHYREGELEAVVADASADPVAYIRSLEAEPLLEQVRVERRPGENLLEIRLKVGE